MRPAADERQRLSPVTFQRSCDKLIPRQYFPTEAGTVAEKKHSFFYDWGSVTTYKSDISSQELVSRAKWFIHMRWYAILACMAAALIAACGILPIRVRILDFALAIVFLSITNLAYSRMGRNLFGDKSRQRDLQFILLLQMFGDFAALSYLVYSLGSVETPMGALFMAHIILATMLFSRWHSLMIATAAWVFATLPLLLVWWDVIPPRSIFGEAVKPMANLGLGYLSAFILASLGVYLFCWYLVSEISSSLKLREHQLEDTYQMLTKIDKEKTQSTLLATHELKAPFAAIKSYVYTLKDGYCGQLPPKVRDVVVRIGERCDQISNRITEIIHLSNLRTLVVTDMRLTPVDLVAIVADESFEGSIVGAPRAIQVINLAEKHPPIYVMGSSAHLKTLFSNLIHNAINYSQNNTGRVVVSIENDEAARASVTIQDNGIGIPKENLDKIFDDHFRSKNAVTHYPGGTGLGLSMVKEIVVLHGASIQVESIVGRGSSFKVIFGTVQVQAGA
jgi:signal transduction histidine kinase